MLVIRGYQYYIIVYNTYISVYIYTCIFLDIDSFLREKKLKTLEKSNKNMNPTQGCVENPLKSFNCR